MSNKKKTKPLNGILCDNIQRKEFKYQKKHVGLSFTLRTDKKDELLMFSELLEKALQDVGAELLKIS